MKVARIFLLAGFAAAASLAQAQEVTKPSEEKSVRPVPVRLTDADLDQITAGDVTVVLVTPGPTSHEAVGNNHTILIFGTSGGGKTSGFVLTPNGLINIPH